MKFGASFSDSVVVSHRRGPGFIKDEHRAWWLGTGRVLLFAVTMIVLFFVLLVRLADLTLVRGHEFRKLAESNRTRELTRHAPRGIVYDRTGVPVVTNSITYRLIKPCDKDTSPIAGGCVEILTQKEGDALRASALPPGTFLETDYSRRYKSPEANAHVVGYTAEITSEELADEYYSLRGYRPGDRVGRMGVEMIFEDRLRGRDGKELVEVDVAGKMVRQLGRIPEIPGSDISLSVDASLTQAVYDHFPKGQKGAVIVTKPATGEILALVSFPSFDSNAFSGGMSQKDYQSLTNNPAMPLFNRVISGVYPPGSTFKLVTALAGLESGSITSQTTVEDTGVINVGPFSFANWYFTQYGRTEGSVNLVKAIQRSNDIYFYKIGEKTGIKNLGAWARRLGVGQKSGSELPGEASGLMPDPAWKQKKFTSPSDVEARNNLWYDGDTYHVAIGQGYLLTTPLQVNRWTNVVASGKLCRPTIEKISQNSEHRAHCSDVGIRPQSIHAVIDGMVKACDSGGTGWPLFGFGIKKPINPQPTPLRQGYAGGTATFTRIPVACKTGTAEFGDPKDKTHAWFTAFAPIPQEYSKSLSPVTGQTDMITGDPEISVTVLVEGAGEGSSVAGPIAREILAAWFDR